MDPTTLLPSVVRTAIIEMARSVDLVWEQDSGTLPASHNANMMQIEGTLLAFGDAVSMVHQLPLSKVGLAPVTSGPDTAGDPNLMEPGPTDVVGIRLDDCGSVGLDAAAVVQVVRQAEAGRTPTDRMGGSYEHMTREGLLAVVVDGLSMVTSRSDPLVVNQGAPTLDNLYMAGSHRQGFRDWSQLLVADRHWDLAHACADILAQCGPSGLAVFLDGYGIDRVDPVRLDWYSHVVALLAA